MSVALAPQLSTTDYLNGERQALAKHEYIQGQIYAMAGASREHNQLVFNLAGLLQNIF